MKLINLKTFFLIMLLAAFAPCAKGQEVAIKTNVGSDALLNINAGTEVGVAPRWTIDVSGDFNSWTLSHGRRWKHWMAQPEVRFWLCDRFAGHFFALDVQGGQYNIGGMTLGHYSFLGTDFRKTRDHRYQGWFVGGGIGYGYAWAISKHFNIEGQLSIGYNFTKYDMYNCFGCSKKVASNRPHNYWGITKAAVNIVYLF